MYDVDMFSEWVENALPEGGIAICLLLPENEKGIVMPVKTTEDINYNDIAAILLAAAEMVANGKLAELEEGTVH